MALFSGIGTKMRGFVRDVWDFLRGEWFDLGGDIWDVVTNDIPDILSDDVAPFLKRVYKDLDPIKVQRGAIADFQQKLADDPNGALAIVLNLAIVASPFSPQVFGQLAQAVIYGVLTLNAIEPTARVQQQVLAELAPETARINWAANRPLLPEQEVAKWEAQKPLAGDQAVVQWIAQRPLVVDQQRAQAEAQLSVADILAAAQLGILRLMAPEQASLQWEAQKPLALDMAVVKAVSDLAAQIEVRPNGIPTSAVMHALFRGIIDRPRFDELMARNGIPPDQLDEYIEASMAFPTPTDLVTWTGREVFEPDSIAKYGLADEFGSVDLALFARVGVAEEFALNYWIAHWDHPSFSQMVNMVHRDQAFGSSARNGTQPLSSSWQQARSEQESELRNWLKLVEIPPYARDGMIAQTYAPLTRVDVRRMHDLGVVDDDGVARVALDIGYDATNAGLYQLFVKVFNAVPDLIARAKNGWIEEESIVGELEALGLPPGTARRIYERKIKAPVVADLTEESRNLTKAEIYKAVNKELISVDDGYSLLLEMNYTPDIAAILLQSNVAALAGSPDSMGELQELAQGWRRAAGLNSKPVPPAAVEMGKRRSALVKHIRDLRARTVDDEEIGRAEKDLRTLDEQYDAVLKDAGLRREQREESSE